MAKKNIEAEGGELILRNSNGDIAIIPKRDRKTVEKLIKMDDHEAIDDYVASLPQYDDYAAEGMLVVKDARFSFDQERIRKKIITGRFSVLDYIPEYKFVSREQQVVEQVKRKESKLDPQSTAENTVIIAENPFPLFTKEEIAGDVKDTQTASETVENKEAGTDDLVIKDEEKQSAAPREEESYQDIDIENFVKKEEVEIVADRVETPSIQKPIGEVKKEEEEIEIDLEIEVPKTDIDPEPVNIPEDEFEERIKQAEVPEVIKEEVEEIELEEPDIKDEVETPESITAEVPEISDDKPKDIPIEEVDIEEPDETVTEIPEEIEIEETELEKKLRERKEMYDRKNWAYDHTITDLEKRVEEERKTDVVKDDVIDQTTYEAVPDVPIVLTEEGIEAIKKEKEKEEFIMNLGKENKEPVDYTQLKDTTNIDSISVRQNNPMNITDKGYNKNNIAGEESPIDGDAPITGFKTVEDGIAAYYAKMDAIIAGESSNYKKDMTIDNFNKKWATSPHAAKNFKSIAKSKYGVTLKGTETLEETIKLVGGPENFARIMAQKENHLLFAAMDKAGYYDKVTSKNYKSVINRKS